MLTKAGLTEKWWSRTQHVILSLQCVTLLAYWSRAQQVRFFWFYRGSPSDLIEGGLRKLGFLSLWGLIPWPHWRRWNQQMRFFEFIVTHILTSWRWTQGSREVNSANEIFEFIGAHPLTLFKGGLKWMRFLFVSINIRWSVTSIWHRKLFIFRSVRTRRGRPTLP